MATVSWFHWPISARLTGVAFAPSTALLIRFLTADRRNQTSGRGDGDRSRASGRERQ
jgi:hypothetical protein